MKIFVGTLRSDAGSPCFRCQECRWKQGVWPERHARGRRVAVEIGTFQGVSAARIVGVLADAGRLYCVDPWLSERGRENPTFTIAKRHLRRHLEGGRVILVQEFSAGATGHLPPQLDFAFIDGDHSVDGLKGDWAIIAPRIAYGGIVCLHDTTVPASEPERMHGSVEYFASIIRHDPRYRLVETVHSMNVLERVA